MPGNMWAAKCYTHKCTTRGTTMWVKYTACETNDRQQHASNELIPCAKTRGESNQHVRVWPICCRTLRKKSFSSDTLRWYPEIQGIPLIYRKRFGWKRKRDGPLLSNDFVFSMVPKEPVEEDGWADWTPQPNGKPCSSWHESFSKRQLLAVWNLQTTSSYLLTF